MAAPPDRLAFGGSRHAALAVTAALHVLLAALFMLRQPERQPEPDASWIDVIQVVPKRVQAAPPAPPPARQQRIHSPAQPRAVADAQAAAALPPERPAQVASEAVFPLSEPAPRSAFELARAAAGKADKELRTAFPERKLLRHKPLTGQQKLAAGIERSVAPPKFYEPARITKVQDQGGWGRRIEKVQTAFGTYCMTYESNLGGDGREVFEDSSTQPKMRTCPREE
jgi:type IV secretory pathway VirB10-like protein